MRRMALILALALAFMGGKAWSDSTRFKTALYKLQLATGPTESDISAVWINVSRDNQNGAILYTMTEAKPNGDLSVLGFAAVGVTPDIPRRATIQ